MLPFLTHKRSEYSASTPVDHKRREPDEGADEVEALEVAAQDLIDAVHKRDAKATCEALRAAFELMESEPHPEGPHTNED